MRYVKEYFRSETIEDITISLEGIERVANISDMMEDRKDQEWEQRRSRRTRDWYQKTAGVFSDTSGLSDWCSLKELLLLATAMPACGQQTKYQSRWPSTIHAWL